MASYKVVLKPSVEKDLRSLPKATVARIIGVMEELGVDPFPRRSVKLEGGEGLYRFRVGDYRIIYGIERNLRRVAIHYVRHRREVYRKL